MTFKPGANADSHVDKKSDIQDIVSKRRRGVAFYLRIGLFGIAALTIITIILAFLTFNTISVILTDITVEAIPTIEKANRLTELARSIDSQARNLPNLHASFAINSTGYELRELGKELDSAIDELDSSVVSRDAIKDIKATMEIMENLLERLEYLVEQRIRMEEKQTEHIRALGEFYQRIETVGVSIATVQYPPPDWARLIVAMLRGTELLIASWSTQDPVHVLANQENFNKQLAVVNLHVPKNNVMLMRQTESILGSMERYKPLFDERLQQLQLEFRIRNAIKGLAIMDRLIHQVGEMSAELSKGSREEADRMNVFIGRLRLVLIGISTICVLGLVAILVYINRRIVTRMSDLQSAMHSYVEGVPLPISTSGFDEISDMASSFLYYVEEVNKRENSLQERTRELDETLHDLTEQSNILNTTMQSMDQGIIMVDGDMRVLSFNNHMARLFSVDRQAMLETHNFVDLQRVLFLATGQTEELLPQYLEKAKSMERLSFEQPLADGRILEIHQSPLEGGGFVRTYTDITERKKAEEALRESQQRLSLLVQSSPMGVIEWDLDFKVIAWNSAAERIFGYSSEEAMGRHAVELIIPEEASQHKDQIWRALLEQKGGARSTDDNVTQDGRRITCEWYNAILINEDGLTIGVASLVDDITERMRVENELKQHLDDLERFNRLVIGREEKMIRLKEEINGLLEQTGRKRKYKVVE